MSRDARKWLAGVAGIGFVALLLVLASGRDEEPAATIPSAPAVPPASPSAASAVPVTAPSPDAGAAARPVPPSLRGTDVDGALPVDRNGHLVPGPDVLALFDYFLAASGEESPERIRERIRSHIRRELAEPAASEAETLLDRYLGYHDELRELAESGDVPHDLERRLQWIRELRRGWFGAELAEALFGEEELVTRIDLERRRVAMDPELDAAERAAYIEALEAELPERVQEARRRSSAPARTRSEVEALRAAGASEAEIFRVREAAFGTGAAERLAALDAERSDWNGRLAAYRSDRDALPSDVDGAEREAALEHLRRQHFREDELERVRALDRFGG